MFIQTIRNIIIIIRYNATNAFFVGLAGFDFNSLEVTHSIHTLLREQTSSKEKEKGEKSRQTLAQSVSANE